MRHAKSSWKHDVSDHERPLNPRGQRAARTIASELARLGWVPDHVLCSDAERTRETLVWMEDTLKTSLPTTHTNRLYLPSVATMLAEVATAPSCNTLMVLSHNPACGEVAHWLTGEEVRVTTANVLRIRLQGASWREAVAGRGLGRLEAVLRPGELGGAGD
jgi:phosphohistidine phosphatase